MDKGIGPGKPVDPRKVYDLACAFSRAAGAANRAAQQELGVMAGILTPDQAHILAPGAAMSAFALELLIKCVVAIETGKAPRGHKLKLLFAAISEPTRRRIADHYKPLAVRAGAPWDGMSLDDVLENSSGAFEFFRYFHENAPSPSVGFTADVAAEAIHAVILELSPPWRVGG